jgi:hypothetical protein
MKRTRVVFLLLGALLLALTGFLGPKGAEAAGDLCWIDQSSCTTTYTGPQGVECCCYYYCPSGSTWVCHQGVYCVS